MEPKTKELTLDAAREALELHIRTTTWLRRDLAKKLTVESFERSGSFHVVFRSFTETRDTGRAHVPYRGEWVDGPQNGPAPAPWDIQVQIPGKFIDRDHYEPVPHTDEVKTCHGCHGVGRVTCSDCGGDGRVRCSTCGGDGRVTRTRSVTRTNSQGQTEHYTETYTETCGVCGGDGQVTCSHCGGSGKITCPTCEGATRLKHYLKLHVAWKTRVSDDVIEKTDLPDEFVAGAVGIVIHAEEEDRLEAAIGGGGGRGPYRGNGGRVNAEVNEMANKLIAAHKFPGGTKLHRQSLVVRSVPVYEAHYRWGKEVRRFWVYGTDEQVHSPNYPLSIIRVGFAIGVPTVALGSIIAFLVASAPSHPPPRPTAATTPPPLPPPPSVLHPLPPPTPIVTQLPPAPLQSATAKAPVAPPGKAVIEIRTEPPSADVTLDGKKVGKTPMFAVIASKGAGVCTFGKCNVGRCTDGRHCEPVTRAKLQSTDGKTFEVELGPSNGPVFEHRF